MRTSCGTPRSSRVRAACCSNSDWETMQHAARTLEDLVRHPEFFKSPGGVLHGLPVGVRAHDDADKRVSVSANLLVSAMESFVFVSYHSHPPCQGKNAGWEAGAPMTLLSPRRYSTVFFSVWRLGRAAFHTGGAGRRDKGNRRGKWRLRARVSR